MFSIVSAAEMKGNDALLDQSSGIDVNVLLLTFNKV